MATWEPAPWRESVPFGMHSVRVLCGIALSLSSLACSRPPAPAVSEGQEGGQSLLNDYPIPDEILARDYADPTRRLYRVHMDVNLDETTFQTLEAAFPSDRPKAWEALKPVLARAGTRGERASRLVEALFDPARPPVTLSAGVILGNYPFVNESLIRDFTNSQKPYVYQIKMDVSISAATWQILATTLRSDRLAAWRALEPHVMGSSPAEQFAHDWIKMLFVP